MLLEALPRGRLRNGSGRGVDRAVTRESWRLLGEVLSCHRGVGGEGREFDPDGGVALEPDDFPVLLSEPVHADVVSGLAANLLDHEVCIDGRKPRGTG